MEYNSDPRGYARHIAGLVKELDDVEKLSIEALRYLGYNDHFVRDVARLSKLLRNIVDTWYREQVYSNRRPLIK